MCLQEYMDRTEKWRIDGSFHPLFLGVNNPHKPVTKSTLTKWILKMLELSGIDISRFQAHSLRAASSSKVASLGLTTADVLSMGNWSRVSTWQKFYHKPISTASDNYQMTLLSGGKNALKEDEPNSDTSL